MNREWGPANEHETANGPAFAKPTTRQGYELTRIKGRN